MLVRKFEAPSIQEALEAVKRELGPDAIILQTKKNKKGFGLLSKASIEITAAVTPQAIEKKQKVDSLLNDSQKEAIFKLPAEKQSRVYSAYSEGHGTKKKQSAPVAPKKVSQPRPAVTQAATLPRNQTTTRYVDIGEDGQTAKPHLEKIRNAVNDSVNLRGNISDEMKNLQRIVFELKEAHDIEQSIVKSEHKLTPALQDSLEQLSLNGLDRRFALSLIRDTRNRLGTEKASDGDLVLDQLAVEIMNNAEVMPLLKGIRSRNEKGFSTDPMYIALVGPTGVGKTTTIAKMASQAVLEKGLKVALINVDTYKIAAQDQLESYSKILKIPFRSIANPDDFELAIKDFANFDLVLIDTTGRSQKDTKSLKEMESMIHSLPNIRTQLVLSATTRDQELVEMGKRFSIFKPDGIIISKLDEAMTFGSIYNISHRLKLPLVYFTTGQKVPEDIEEATKERIVSLVMNL